FGLFSASLAAKYTRDSTDTRQSINFNYLQSMSADATFTVKGLGNNILSSDAQSILAQGNDAFTNVCGNSIIQSAKEGAVLIINVSIQFANAALKEQFEGEASGSIAGIGSIRGAFEHSEQTSTKNATFAVKAYQLGGDPTKLAKIFGNPDPQGQYNIVKCSATDLDSCQAIINDVIAYAQQDFQTSVNFKDLSSLYTYEVTAKEYSRFGVQAFLTPLTPAEQDAKNYLTTTITQDRRMLNYLTAYQQQSFYNSQYVDDATQRYIAKATGDYTTMIDNYDNFDIINACYGDTNKINTECISAADQVKSMRNMYQSSISVGNNLALMILMNSPVGTMIFVPVMAFDHAVGDLNNNVTGIYAAYSTVTKTYSSICYIDTSPDDEYFKTYFPQYGTDSLECIDAPMPIVPGVTKFHVWQFGNRSYQGIGAHFVNGQETPYPVNPSGDNTEYGYSDSSDFKFSPI
ncbi:MAG TPA: hypothetical protein VKR58_07600, partial [Aquella sp.]|nr:hypothetical protein [Aquella sp.]